MYERGEFVIVAVDGPTARLVEHDPMTRAEARAEARRLADEDDPYEYAIARADVWHGGRFWSERSGS
jgi:hypothetical protein